MDWRYGVEVDRVIRALMHKNNRDTSQPNDGDPNARWEHNSIVTKFLLPGGGIYCFMTLCDGK